MTAGLLFGAAAVLGLVLGAVALAYHLGYGAGQTAAQLDATRDTLADLEEGLRRSRTAAEEYDDATADLAAVPPPDLVRSLWVDSAPADASSPGSGAAHDPAARSPERRAADA